MRKIFLFLLILTFTATLFAQASAKRLTKREKLIFKINREVEDDTVIELLRKYNNDIRRSIKDKEPLTYLQYYSFALTIDAFIKYRWFIADTGLSKRWLSDIQKLVEYMYKTRDIIQTATNNNQTESAKYKQAVKYFDVAQKRFIKLVKKPVKVSNKIKRRAKVARVLWEKSMKKKYKIKDKEKTGLEEF